MDRSDAEEKPRFVDIITMKRSLIGSLVLTLLLVSGSFASGFFDLGGQIKLPRPDGWGLGSDSTEFPFQIVDESQTAELLIFRSEITGDGVIRNKQELRGSVDKVVNDIILELPKAKLLSSTGYYDTNRVSFVLDFESTDTASGLEITHRLKGYMYRHPDGHQILFTLWGKTGKDNPPDVMSSIRLMQDGFAYYGPAEAEFFETPSRPSWYWLVLVFGVLLLIFYFFRRKRLSRIGFSDDSNFWRCECGRMNANQYDSCRRCGRKRQTDLIS
ncbi:MAG TPA: hypothetical protein VJ983_03440 [candidate division Zixibacteria bacterium]|nr:hypothetical protein [candidate division Zixibacteria bacterium]